MREGSALQSQINASMVCVEFFLARRPSSSAVVRGLVIHDIKKVGVRQQEEQEDKRDEEIGDEVNGEDEEVTQRAHET